MRGLAGSGFVFLLALGFQLSGYQSLPFAICLWAIASIVAVWEFATWTPIRERLIRANRNYPMISLLTAITIGAGIGGVALGLIWHFAIQEQADVKMDVAAKPLDASVTINCTPVAIPLRGKQGDLLYAIYLDPKWGNQLVSTPSTSWPTWATPNDTAYRCEVVNNCKLALHGLSVVFMAMFREGAGLPTRREISIISPMSVEPQHSVVFHIADDTKQAQEVIPPESVSARVGDDKERRTIPVRYSTVDGRPVRLRGFIMPSIVKDVIEAQGTSKVAEPPKPKNATLKERTFVDEGKIKLIDRVYRHIQSECLSQYDRFTDKTIGPWKHKLLEMSPRKYSEMAWVNIQESSACVNKLITILNENKIYKEVYDELIGIGTEHNSVIAKFRAFEEKYKKLPEKVTADNLELVAEQGMEMSKAVGKYGQWLRDKSEVLVKMRAEEMQLRN
jgi:hypothetical protein